MRMTLTTCILVVGVISLLAAKPQVPANQIQDMYFQEAEGRLLIGPLAPSEICTTSDTALLKVTHCYQLRHLQEGREIRPPLWQSFVSGASLGAILGWCTTRRD
jgi:hypothetical protein